jgi:hypothetical protein
MRLSDLLPSAFATLSDVLRGRRQGRPRQIDPKRAWFWSRQWQMAEREADADMQAGRYEDFDSIDQVIAVLKQNAISDPPDAIDRLAAALRRTVRRRK